MLMAHRTALVPNNKQATYFARAAGTARFAYNWALARWQKQYAACQADKTLPQPNQYALRRQLNAIKREQFPWMLEVTKCAPQLAIVQLGAAGVDLGVSALATLSTGERIAGPKPHRALLGRLQRLSRSLSRKRKGSQNRQKAKDKLSRLHARMANIRQNALHQLTHALTSRFKTLVIEDLNVRGMTKNRHLARSIADMGFFEFRRQLTYKAALCGGSVLVADRFFASSKLCSSCGHRLEELAHSAREWLCPECGSRHDRDVNAALNLRNLAVSSTVSACGEEGSGPLCEGRVKPASMKQEANSKPGQI